jgi:hypothetical protein
MLAQSRRDLSYKHDYLHDFFILISAGLTKQNLMLIY